MFFRASELRCSVVFELRKTIVQGTINIREALAVRSIRRRCSETARLYKEGGNRDIPHSCHPRKLRRCRPRRRKQKKMLDANKLEIAAQAMKSADDKSQTRPIQIS